MNARLVVFLAAQLFLTAAPSTFASPVAAADARPNAGAPARHHDRLLRAELTLAAPVDSVWKAWTTDAGIASFFAPEGHVRPAPNGGWVDGTFDVWFDPDAAPGGRGAEGMRIVAYEPGRRFGFTWNAPPAFPAIRGQRTLVLLDFAPGAAGTTRLRFSEIGWGEGAEWDQAYDYFDRAWSAVVLPRLVHRFEHGPIDWNHVPSLASLGSMKRTFD